MAPYVTTRTVVSYTAFSPLPAEAGGYFLLHCPGSRLRRTLSGILPCGARTFLTNSGSPEFPRSSVSLKGYYTTLVKYSIYNKTRIASLLRNSRNPKNIRNPQIFTFVKIAASSCFLQVANAIFSLMQA